MPDYEKGHYSLTDLIERGGDIGVFGNIHGAYGEYGELPYEARQALLDYSNDFHFEPMTAFSRLLPYNYPYVF